jgi:hypothetical protein
MGAQADGQMSTGAFEQFAFLEDGAVPDEGKLSSRAVRERTVL